MSLPTLATAVALVALCVWGIAASYVNHDPAWYLHVAGAWLRGATLYRDVVDTNPPLIIWLSTPPVAVATLSGLGVPAVFKAYVLLVAAAMLLLAGDSVRRVFPSVHFPLTVAAVFLTLPFAREDFGQREHFAVLMTLPYVLLATASPLQVPWRMGVLVGVLGGLGFAIKPHFLAAWIAVECVVLAVLGRRAVLRPALLAAAAAIGVYAVAVLALTPHYVDVVQRVRQVYGALDNPVTQLLRMREVLLWLAAMVLLVAVRWGGSLRLLLALFAAGSGYLVAALVQGKGWPYQFYPARVFLLLVFAAMAAALPQLLPRRAAWLRAGRTAWGLGVAAFFIALSARYALEAHARPDSLIPRIIEVTETHGGDGPVALLAMRTHLYPAFPAISYTRARWSLRYNALFFLPAFYTSENSQSGSALPPHAPERMPALERTFFDEVVEDLCARPPQLLIVEQPPLWSGPGLRGLDLLAYYRQSERAARLFSRYSQRGEAGAYVFLVPDGELSCEEASVSQ